MTPSKSSQEAIDRLVADLHGLYQRLRNAGDDPSLDYLQQQLFILGAQIGETIDALDASRLDEPGAIPVLDEEP